FPPLAHFYLFGKQELCRRAWPGKELESILYSPIEPRHSLALRRNRSNRRDVSDLVNCIYKSRFYYCPASGHFTPFPLRSSLPLVTPLLAGVLRSTYVSTCYAMCLSRCSMRRGARCGMCGACETISLSAWVGVSGGA